jgi:predicted hotdog family 3-hydroxylacyl-ACP dehydratase
MDYFSHPISALVPHADPMLLIHGLVEQGETWLIAAVDLSRTNLFATTAGIPSYVALEYMAQTISAYAGSQNSAKHLPPHIGFLLGTRHFVSSSVYLPSEGTALIRVDVIFAEASTVSLFDCRMYLALAPGTELARATIKAFQPDDAHAILETLNL